MAKKSGNKRGGTRFSSMKDRVKQRVKERASSGSGTLSLPDGIEFVKKIEEGNKKKKFDIIPYQVTVDHRPDAEKGEYVESCSYKRHSQIGVQENSYVCPTSIGNPCPICEEWIRLRKVSDADNKEVKALKPQNRELYNVNDLGEKDGKIRVFDYSEYLFANDLNKKLKRLIDEPEDDDDYNYSKVYDLVGGKTIKVYFEKNTKLGFPFFETSEIDFIDRKEDYDEDILDEVCDLDRALKILSYKDLEKVFMGVGNEEEDDVPYDTPPTDDDEEPEEDEPEEEEDDDKPPVKKKKGGKKKEEKNRCPHTDDGVRFGVDHEGYEECDDCTLYSECKTENKRLNK